MNTFANTKTGTAFSVDQTGLVQDTEKFLCPQLRIVPDDSPILAAPDGQYKCSICWGKYAESVDSGDGCDGGGTRILSCGHVFGRDCIINSMLAGNNNRCPLCRKLYHLRYPGKFLSRGILDDLQTELKDLTGPDFAHENGWVVAILMLFVTSKFVFFYVLAPTFNFVELTMGVASRDPVRKPSWILCYGLRWIFQQTLLIGWYTIMGPVEFFVVFHVLWCVLYVSQSLWRFIRNIPACLRWLYFQITEIPYYLGILIMVFVVKVEAFLRWAGPWPILEFLFPPFSPVRNRYSWIVDKIFGVGIFLTTYTVPARNDPLEHLDLELVEDFFEII